MAQIGSRNIKDTNNPWTDGNIWSQRVQTPKWLFICLMIIGDRADLRVWIEEQARGPTDDNSEEDPSQ
jgi:hypothetical protein